ncbi:MAG: zinc-binding dehydrogenase [Alphaproteobacteria bacterium]|nr:zinc-binding dehydrogenase [Alphaproteobacteria bacterium]
MKQVIQSHRTGTTTVADVPRPSLAPGKVLVETTRTLISAGTERMVIEFGKAGWLAKARLQPDKVRMVLDKVRTDGLRPTIDALLNKLDQPLALGNSNVGRVLEKGSGLLDFQAGDRVVSNGYHAELVSVPVNLCARVPDAVSDEEAAFTVIGAIALQGVRLVQPTLGESVAVAGLGLIGLMTVQLLRANGCRVLGIDLQPQRLELARRLGADVVNLAEGGDPLAAARSLSRGRGVDAVIVTASTKSSDPMRQAAQMCRKRGRIVLVGVTGLELSRADFYEKELTFQVSCSYGPGRYDPNYEEKGQDYPVGFVRWTEQRNFEAVLDMMADGRLDVKPLISHRFRIDEAERAYELVAGPEPSLGILLEYPSKSATQATELRGTTVKLGDRPAAAARSTTAFIGAGSYATAVLIPAFREAGAQLKVVASSGGLSGVHAGRKFGFAEATSDTESAIGDPEVDTVVITTRHDSHARLAIRALRAGKHVFVEKPLALKPEELDEIESAYAACGGRSFLMVGFNRRFAPQIVKIKTLLAAVSGPKAFVVTVNAGAIPASHWTQDPEVGGGRIVGEACHFVDLLRFLAGVPIIGARRADVQVAPRDTASLELRFADGSLGTIHYFANGSKSFPKERLEVFAAGGVLQLENFRRLRGFGWHGFSKFNLWRQDKGQKACARAFVEAIRAGGPAPIPFTEIMEVSRVSIELAGCGG